MTARIVWLWVVALVGLWPCLAAAHPNAISGFGIEVKDSTVEVELRLDATSCIDLVERTSEQTTDRASFDDARAPMLAYFDERLHFDADGTACPRGATGVLGYDAAADRMVVRTQYDCPTPPEILGIHTRLFTDEDTPHRIMAGVVYGNRSHRYVFGGLDTRASVPLAKLPKAIGPAAGFEGRRATPPPGAFSPRAPDAASADETDAPAQTDATTPPPGNTVAPASFVSDIWLGISHILGGPDHVLFVLCLLLAATTGRRLLLVVTAFTVAHSITLVLGALQLVIVSPRLVEPVIALSIVWVAVEGVWRPQHEARPAAAFGFGLAHGLGFCGVLAGLGLTSTELAGTLLGFNVGVELGQLAIVLTAWPLWLWWQAKYPERAQQGRRVLYGLIALVAVYWFFERVLG